MYAGACQVQVHCYLCTHPHLDLISTFNCNTPNRKICVNLTDTDQGRCWTNGTGRMT
jgi:hypothetical protein